MTQHLGQGLDLKTAFYAPGREAVPQSMKVRFVNAGLPEIFLELILHDPGLCDWQSRLCHKVFSGGMAVFEGEDQVSQERRQWDGAKGRV